MNDPGSAVYDPDPYVKSGARLLDLDKPSWYRRINLVKLDMRHSAVCMLGQLNAGSFHKGVIAHRLKTDPDGVADFGFAVPPLYWGPRVEREYQRLTNAWKKLIRARIARDLVLARRAREALENESAA